MGGKFKQMKGSKDRNGSMSRKEMRKKIRKEKKARKNDYFRIKKKVALTQLSTNDSLKGKAIQKPPKNKRSLSQNGLSKENNTTTAKPKSSFLEEQNKFHKQEIREKQKLERGMIKKRKKILLEANKDEEKEIKKLEKQLKLNKRKSKSIPKSFTEDGLDYLLEVCEADKLKEAASAEMNLQESDSEFEDDFAIITGKRKHNKKDESSKKIKKIHSSPQNKVSSDDNASSNDEFEVSASSEEDSEEMDLQNSDFDFEDESPLVEAKRNNYSEPKCQEDKKKKKCSVGTSAADKDQNFDGEENISSSSDEENNRLTLKKQDLTNNEDEVQDTDSEYEGDSLQSDGDESGNDMVGTDEDVESDNENGEEDFENTSKDLTKEHKNGLWEDIYGRLRDKIGNVVQEQEKGKYIPPHLRAKQMAEDSKKTEELTRLKKQLKGLINRLAESNIHNIANQIDELYMRNSRNDMNDTLLSLISEALFNRVLTAERLVMEHALLIAVLHANVGMEVGAHFLQSFVEKFDTMYRQGQDVENKELDNVLLIISHLYNFKIFHAVLMYNLLDQLAKQFTEKEVELILLVLRSVGLSLRKDDPSALKDLVLRLQKRANESTHLRDNPRVRFMLDVLMAVKNNNMAKIPLYDPSYSEHLKKLLKTLVHKGKYVTEIKVTLDDLLKADERGRWWIVGSAWSGAPATVVNTNVPASDSQFSQKVLDAARKQRMNTDTRRNIFCILMTAEDYLDAFEKLLRLGLKGLQEREILHVMVHCVLQEKEYNPYYSVLAAHFCEVDRKYQMTLHYHLWDKLKEMSNLKSKFQITNLAKFLAHLFLEKALPISVLKVIEFSEINKPTVSLLRQVLLSVLLSDNEESLTLVFARVARSEQLRMFRQSLRLFLHVFVLKKAVTMPLDQAQLLRDRVKMAETALLSVDTSKFF